MTSVSTAIAGMTDALQSAAGVAVTYERGIHSVVVTAAVGRTRFEVDDGSGVRVESNARDYLIKAAELILNSVVVLPERGDRITEGTDIYEVMGPGAERHYGFSDTAGSILRIHTRLVG